MMELMDKQVGALGDAKRSDTTVTARALRTDGAEPRTLPAGLSALQVLAFKLFSFSVFAIVSFWVQFCLPHGSF